MSQNISKPKIQHPDTANKDKPKTAFMQVPFELKDQIQAHLEQLTAASGAEFMVGDQSIEALPTQGCFLVISLDKIEEIINGLKSCLTMEPGNEAQNIKSEIKRVLTMLS